MLLLVAAVCTYCWCFYIVLAGVCVYCYRDIILVVAADVLFCEGCAPRVLKILWDYLQDYICVNL